MRSYVHCSTVDQCFSWCPGFFSWSYSCPAEPFSLQLDMVEMRHKSTDHLHNGMEIVPVVHDNTGNCARERTLTTICLLWYINRYQTSAKVTSWAKEGCLCFQMQQLESTKRNCGTTVSLSFSLSSSSLPPSFPACSARKHGLLITLPLNNGFFAKEGIYSRSFGVQGENQGFCFREVNNHLVLPCKQQVSQEARFRADPESGDSDLILFSLDREIPSLVSSCFEVSRFYWSSSPLLSWQYCCFYATFLQL